MRMDTWSQVLDPGLVWQQHLLGTGFGVYTQTEQFLAVSNGFVIWPWNPRWPSQAPGSPHLPGVCLHLQASLRGTSDCESSAFRWLLLPSQLASFAPLRSRVYEEVRDVLVNNPLTSLVLVFIPLRKVHLLPLLPVTFIRIMCIQQKLITNQCQATCWRPESLVLGTFQWGEAHIKQTCPWRSFLLRSWTILLPCEVAHCYLIPESAPCTSWNHISSFSLLQVVQTNPCSSSGWKAARSSADTVLSYLPEFFF